MRITISEHVRKEGRKEGRWKKRNEGRKIVRNDNNNNRNVRFFSYSC